LWSGNQERKEKQYASQESCEESTCEEGREENCQEEIIDRRALALVASRGVLFGANYKRGGRPPLSFLRMIGMIDEVGSGCR
jgi:hypothetical protein